MTAQLCLWLAVGTVGCVLLECLCQNIADRLQAAAGYMVFADLRMELGRHLRRLPMGYFTEGNIGKISSVLSTDMVFIEENCMHDIANMMSYTFAQGHPGAVAGLPESLAGTGRLGGGRDHLAVGPRFPGGAPWLTLMFDRSRARRSHGQCWTMWRASASPRPSTCWESVPSNSPKFCPEPKVSIEFEWRARPLDAGPSYLVCGLGSVLIIPLSSGSMAGGSSPSPSCWVSCSRL